LSFGQRSGHQQVLRAGHGHHVGGDARALQAATGPWNARFDVAARHRDLGPHGLQPLDVLVNRAGPDGAAPRQGHARTAKAGQQRPEHQDGRPHGLDHLVRRFWLVQPCRIEVKVA